METIPVERLVRDLQQKPIPMFYVYVLRSNDIYARIYGRLRGDGYSEANARNHATGLTIRQSDCTLIRRGEGKVMDIAVENLCHFFSAWDRPMYYKDALTLIAALRKIYSTDQYMLVRDTHVASDGKLK